MNFNIGIRIPLLVLIIIEHRRKFKSGIKREGIFKIYTE